MEIKKETKIVVKTTDDNLIDVGDKVYFINKGIPCVGIFDGLNSKGALKFLIPTSKKTFFNVMPKSISEIYLIDEFELWMGADLEKGDK